MGKEPPPAPWPAGSSTAPHAKATLSCPQRAPNVVLGHVLRSSSHPGQHPRGHPPAASPVPLGQETQLRGQSCPEPLLLTVASTFPPRRGVPGTAPRARVGVQTQAPCTCLPGVVLAAGDPEFTVAKGTEKAPERLLLVGAPRRRFSQPNSLTLSLLLSSGWKSIGD